MGSFNINCAISNLPINNGENIVAFFIGEHWKGSQRYRNALSPWDHWELLSFPIYTKMDNYGMWGCWGKKDQEEEWLATADKYSAWAFKQFRKHIFYFGKNKYSAENNPYDERDWRRAMDGENDSRYAAWAEIDPNTNIENKDVLKFCSSPVRFQTYFVRRDIYDYLIERYIIQDCYKPEYDPSNLINEWWDCAETLSKLKFTDPEYAEIWHKTSDIRRSDGLHNELKMILRRIVENKNNLVEDDIRARIKLECGNMMKLISSLYIAQKNIQPNLGMAPQCGWFRTEYMKPMMDYQKFLINIGERKLKDIEDENY